MTTMASIKARISTKMDRRSECLFCLVESRRACPSSTLLSTQFEPTDARKAFPCFDEPHLKAVFKLKMLHPENTVALGNAPIVR